MKAFSVRAPWWWFLLYAGKDVENRSTRIQFGGRRLIHASRRWVECEIFADIEAARQMAPGLKLTRALPGGGVRAIMDDLRAGSGRIVGSIEICGCVDRSESPWFCGPYGWMVRGPQAFAYPQPFVGMLGFFEVPEDVVRACRGEVRG